VIREKFSAHQELRRKLVEAVGEDDEGYPINSLVEASPIDNFWGFAPKPDGSPGEN